MTPRSSLRLSRLSDRAATLQRQLIAFKLSHTGFLLPIDAVYRATVFPKSALGQGQLMVDDHPLQVTNIKPLVLNSTLQSSSEDPMAELISDSGVSPQAIPESAVAVLILQEQNGQPHSVIPIDSAPALCRISEDYFVPLSQAYTMNCVEEMTDRQGDYPLHFVLNPEQLLSQIAAQKLPQEGEGE